LDYKTDAILRSRLKEVTENATVLIVAQRVGTIMDADQIIVLNEGEIVGRGTHNELMENNEIYREIANSQLNRQSLTEE
ncbi:MAG: ABC transporter ATP-binding protein, partial [Streptococcus sp.]|nr:ABC transporter ATP-binding protein [Streptococcus sp.]